MIGIKGRVVSFPDVEAAGRDGADARSLTGSRGERFKNENAPIIGPLPV